MNITVSPQGAVDAGCTAFHTSSVSHSDTYEEQQTGGETTLDEFNGTFPIITTHASVGWLVNHISGVVEISTTRRGETTTREEEVIIRSDEIHGDVVNLFDVLKARNVAAHGDWDPIAKYGTEKMDLFDGEYVVRRYTRLGEIVYKYRLLSLEVVFTPDLSEVFIRTLASPVGAGTTTGQGSYRVGSTVTITASPNEGYTFLYWTKDGGIVSRDLIHSFTAIEDATYIANFGKIGIIYEPSSGNIMFDTASGSILCYA